jgi:hypothetical protein
MAAVASKSIPKFRYLTAWFCPFAHRATLALEHHKGRVDYESVEVSRLIARGERLGLLFSFSLTSLGFVSLFFR